MDWFEEWFDSRLYEKLYANRDETEAKRLIDLLLQTLNANNCHKILDLACGRGRHSLNLAEKGYSVTGIDLSEQAIQTAQEKAEQRNLANVHFKVHDMRKPLDDQFDAVVNLFTSFGYFLSDQENAQVFDNVAAMLKPDGLFVIDYLNAHKVRKEYVPTGQGSFNQIDYKIKRYIEDEAIHKEITFSKGDKTKTYSERVKLYDLSWFKQALKKWNLNIEKIYGNYEGDAFTAEESPRLLLVARLNNE